MKKWLLKISLTILILCTTILEIGNTIPLEITEEIDLTDYGYTIQDLYKGCLMLGYDLKSQLQISPEKFADYCIVVMWCESNAKTNSKDGSQQGLIQFTKETRKRLGMPQNITSDDLRTQLHYVKMFLLKTHRLRSIRTAEQLHALYFAPSRFGDTLSMVDASLKGLDMDGDSIITLNDFRLFHESRAPQNPFVNNIWKKIKKI